MTKFTKENADDLMTVAAVFGIIIAGLLVLTVTLYCIGHYA